MAEAVEMQNTFDLRWKADQRAIKRWHEAGGNPLVWPDHADLCMWLLGQIEDWKLAAGTEADERRKAHAEIGRLKEIIANYEALEKL